MGGKTTTATATMDPIQEKFITDDLLPFARNIIDTPFEAYSGNRVADLTDMQRDAIGGYGQFSTTPEQRQARLSEVQEQMAPMLNRQFAQEGIGREAQAIKANAFGDRRAAYEGERQAALDAMSYQLASKELDRQDAALRTNLGAQMTAGEAERALSQQELDAAYDQYLARMQYPLTQFGVLSGAGQAFPAGIGTTVERERDPMGTFGRALSGLGSFGMGGGMGMFR